MISPLRMVFCGRVYEFLLLYIYHVCVFLRILSQALSILTLCSSHV